MRIAVANSRREQAFMRFISHDAYRGGLSP